TPDLLGRLAGDGIERPHLGAALQQAFDQGDRRGVTHVIRVRLEGEAEDTDDLPLEIAAHAALDALNHVRLAVSVDGYGRPDDALVDPGDLRGLQKRQRILREA